jgi:AcrR family transcriptional regulator
MVNTGGESLVQKDAAGGKIVTGVTPIAAVTPVTPVNTASATDAGHTAETAMPVGSVSSVNREVYARFHAIAPSKQQRILRAALEEFAAKDYASASTNAIVAQAQISKGLLFHYFNDKLGLYLYLLDHVARELYRDVMGLIDLENDDIFDIMQKTIEVKLEVANRSVLETRLYLRALTGDIPPQAKELLEQSVAQAYDTFALMLSLLNEDYLREGLDKEKVVQALNWLCEGITNHLLATIDTKTGAEGYAHMMDYTSDYFAFFRNLFYKGAHKSETNPGEKGK